MSTSPSRSQSHDRRLDDVIADYYLAQERGETPNRELILTQNPEFAVELREFFSGLSDLEAIAPPAADSNQVTQDYFSSGGPFFRPGATVRYLGDYEILEQIGSGGMGLVFKARQKKLKRIVALKMIRSGAFASEAEVQRFKAEARAAARLEHPHIVAVHEIDALQGFHYFTMDYVGGGTLATAVREKPWTARHAAEVVVLIAQAMQYAHEQGVLHRDLKPGNVLLSSSGEPRITDFGLAKRLLTEGETELACTETGAVLGTAGYMSPEQAAGKTRLVGAAADVYGLGAILYSLVTSRAPFVGDSPATTLLQVMHQEPVTPRMLNPDVPQDLETIILKCLEKEPHKRYGTAQLLADDLQRFLDGRPILARRVGAIERSAKWCRRNPLVATLIAAIASSLLLGTVVSMRYAQIAWAMTGQLIDRTAESEKARNLAEQAGKQSEKDKLRAEAAKRRATESEKEALWRLYAAQVASLWDAHKSREWGRLDRLLREATPSEVAPDFRGWEWKYLRTQTDRASKHIDSARKYEGCSAFCPRTGELAFATQDSPRQIEIWNVSDRRRVRVLPMNLTGTTQQIEWSPDGTMLAYSAYLQGYKVVQSGNGDVIHSAELTSQRTGVAWSRDGKQLAVAAILPTRFLLVDTTSWKPLPTPPSLVSKPIVGLAFHPDGRLAMGGNNELLIWNISEAEPVIHSWPGYRPDRFTSLAWNPTGTRLAMGCQSKLIIGDATGVILHDIQSLEGHQIVSWIDDDHVATAGNDHSVCLWNATTGKRTHEWRPHGSPVISLVPYGKQGDVVTVSWSGEVRFWNALRAEVDARNIRVGHDKLGDLAWSKSGREVFVAQGQGQVSRWDAISGERLNVWNLPTSQAVTSLAQAGGELACVQQGGALTVISTSGVLLREGGPVAETCAPNWNPENTQLAVVTADWNGQTIDSTAFGQVREFSPIAGCLHTLFSPQGDYVAACSWGNVFVLDRTGKKHAESAWESTGYIYQIAFSPDGKQIAAAVERGGVFIFDANDLTRIMTLEGHSGPVVSVQWSHDGTRVATASVDRTVRIWDAATFAPLGVLAHPSQSEFTRVAWSPDGHRLAATSGNGSLVIWSTQADPPSAASVRHLAAAQSSVFPEIEVREIRAQALHTKSAASVAFNPAGQLASVGADRKARIVDFRKPGSSSLVELNAAGDEAHAQTLRFLHRGSKLLLAWHGTPGKVQLWDWQQKKLLWQRLSGATSLAVSPDETLLVTANWQSTELRVLDLVTGTEIKVLSGAEVSLAARNFLTTNVAFAPDGKSFVSVCGSSENASTPQSILRSWNRETLECEQEVDLGRIHIHGLRFLTNERLLLGGADRRLIVLKATAAGPHVKREDLEAILARSASEDPNIRVDALKQLRELGTRATPLVRQIIAQSTPEATLNLRRSSAGLENVAFPMISESRNRLGSVVAVDCTADGSLVVAAALDDQTSQGEITLARFDRLSEPLFRWSGPGVTCVAISSDDRYLAAGFQDGTVRTWEILQGTNRTPHPELAALTKMIQDSPYNSDAWFERGTWHTRRQDWRLAKIDFEEGVRVNPRHVNCRAHAAGCCSVLQDHAAHAEHSRALYERLLSDKDLDKYSQFLIVNFICQGPECLPDYKLVARTGAALAAGTREDYLWRAHMLSVLRSREWEKAIALSRRLEALPAPPWEMVALCSVRAIALKHLQRLNEAHDALAEAETNFVSVQRTPGVPLTMMEMSCLEISIPLLKEARDLLERHPVPSLPIAKVPALPSIKLLSAFEGHTGFVHRVQIFDEGRSALTVGSDGQMLQWDLKKGKPAGIVGRVDSRISAMAIDSQRPVVFVGKPDGGIEVWDWKERRRLEQVTGSSKFLHSLAVMADSGNVLAASNDGVRIWNFGAEQRTSKVIHNAAALRAAQGIEGTIVVAGSSHLHFLDNQGNQLFVPVPTGGVIQGLTISPDGKLALTLGGKQFEEGDEPGLVLLWDIATGKLVRSFSGHRGLVNDGVFTSDGRHIITGGRCDQTLRLWHVASGRELARGTARSHATNYVAVTPDDKYVLSGGGEYRSTTGWPSDGEHRLFLWELPDLQGE